MQRLILPPLFDPTSKSRSRDDELPDDGAQNSQAQAFAQSRGGPKRGIGLPRGGGPFKGFAFVVLRNAEDVDRALSTYPWQGEPKTREAQRDPDDADDEADAHMEEGRDEPDPKGKGKAKKAKPSPAEKSKNAGLRALK